MDHKAVTLPQPDYDAEDVLVLDDPEQLRALADETRMKLIALLRERAASTSDLAEQLDAPKGTIGHHLKVLERAGLVRIVRTRRVRAVTEKSYGRTARLFVVKGADPEATLGGAVLRQAAEEVGPSGADPERSTFGLGHARLRERDALRFRRRVDRLIDDLHAAEHPDGDPFTLAVGLFPTEGGFR